MTKRDRAPSDKRDRPAADTRWNEKHGTPKDPGLAKTVERASSRYSASEQSEQKSREKSERSRSERPDSDR
jgi:hypothetical protein